jgi:hypothetical protein
MAEKRFLLCHPFGVSRKPRETPGGEKILPPNLRSALAVLALMIVRIGVPVAGIWLLGAALKHAVGPHRNSR